MKESYFILWLLILISGTLDSQSNSFEYSDTEFYRGNAIVFTKNYIASIQLPSNVERFTPSKEQLRKAEQILVKKYNNLENSSWKKEKDVRKKYRKYNRQYLAYKNINGDRQIIINLLNFKCKRKAEEKFDGWRDFFIVGFGSYYEKNSIRFVVNIDSSTLRFL